ncbi:MAG: extracellular solute-binding protein, partial [Gammaproteobacteria bacterium]|nr:extracellular solute-binding protein [Gammaproteobacteria bacterium]
MFVLVFALFACDQTQKSDHSASVSNSAEQAESSELVLYSSRNEQLILPLIEAYEAETGTRVKFVTDKPEPLIEKLKAEAELTPADVLMTVDAGNLWRASQADLFMSLESEVLEKAIPTNLRDENMQWFGFSQRARTIVYSVERVKPEELSTYENLANEKWHGKLCLRTSKKVYNQSLVAMLIATHGTGVTENIIT